MDVQSVFVNVISISKLVPGQWRSPLHIVGSCVRSLLLFGLLSAAMASALASPETVDAYQVAPTPDWVVSPDSYQSSRKNQAYDGFDLHYRLYNQQVNITQADTEYYFEYVYELTNRSAVEENSQLEIDFDPSYESVDLHQITVIRDSKEIDKLASSAFQLMQRERGFEQLIYDGTQTLAVILDDVRVGDTIKYSYTLTGDNPIYSGQREFGFRTDYGIPVDRLYLRVVANQDKQLSVRKFNTDVEVVHTALDEYDQYVIDLKEVEEFSEEADVPAWRERYGNVVFSDVENWRGVVSWATPMYSLDGLALEKVATIAEKIQSRHSDTDAQVGAALRWVQNEIRYFGVEMGVNSHQPSAPELTLQRRFGDCKDKSLLLIALLDALGLESVPALVNSDRGLENAKFPWRLHAFDHVIVHLPLNGKSHWLDPTAAYQKGGLGDFTEPDFGRALLLDNESSGLVAMNPAAAARQKIVTKKLLIPAGDDPVVNLTVDSRHLKRSAKSIRYRLEDMGVRELSDSYLDYYQEYFDAISSAHTIDVVELPENTVETSETYNVADFWMEDGEFEKYKWLFADEVQAYLDVPEDEQRENSLKVQHPVNIEEVWEVVAPHRLRLDDLDGTEENEFFSLTKSHEYDKQSETLKVTFKYESRAEEVLPEQLEKYRNAVVRADDMASFYIEDKGSSYNPATEDADKTFLDFYKEELSTYDLVNIAVSAIGLFGIGIALLFRFFVGRRTEDS